METALAIKSLYFLSFISKKEEEEAHQNDKFLPHSFLGPQSSLIRLIPKKNEKKKRDNKNNMPEMIENSFPFKCHHEFEKLKIFA